MRRPPLSTDISGFEATRLAGQARVESAQRGERGQAAQWCAPSAGYRPIKRKTGRLIKRPEKKKAMASFTREAHTQTHALCLLTQCGVLGFAVLFHQGESIPARLFIYHFTQDDTPTPDGLTSSLLFAATERSDSGLYTCLTANKFGKDETNIKLLVQETPDAPDDIRVVEATSRRISLRWNTPFNGNSDILGYFLQWKEVSGTWQKDSRHVEVPGSNTSAVLDDLEPITAYHLRVLSVNKFGRSEPSPMISVTTDEEVPSKPPEDLVLVPLSSQVLKASWKPPPNFSAHGRIRGYYVGYKPVGSGESFVYKTIDVLDGFVPEISINNLKRSTKYSVIVQAFNGKGAGPPSAEITAQTFEHGEQKADICTFASVYKKFLR
ncbi:hypothetical protein HPB51_025440 [Rhipicephalus microplus]|uniref:Fibronectin type-III domain-containing protein n=1 Tax=Rhipicephalus microplus TaxID=6941 RepID=A0A9J6DY49_RHIMP|nr:hypothetical protein HPB51_025440 [Rhipicephalus microplus]